MKTIITKLSVFCLVFLLSSFLKAQGEELYPYRGGNADGFATETVENNSCGAPFHLFAYFGGMGDGGSVETIADNATCGTPYHHFAYFGGNGDGATVENLENASCSTPYHFYAYFGGNGDGLAVDKTTDVCPIDPPVADFTADKTTICTGQTVKFTDTSTNKPTGWTWTFDGGSPATASTKVVNVTYNTAGVYQVKLVAANYIGTGTVTKLAYINVVSDCSTLGTSNTEIKKTQIYPNPTKNILYIKSPREIKNIEVFDSSGRKIMNVNPNQKETQVNLEKLNSGNYILRTHSENGVESYKVIKKD